jgi:hypothetical protein
MVSLVGIVVGIAAVLAVLVTSVVIVVCLAVSWATDTARSARPPSRREVRGGGRHADNAASLPGQRAQERFPGAGRLAYDLRGRGSALWCALGHMRNWNSQQTFG